MPTDPFDLQGRIALVTGASRGIGRAIASRLATHGATVVVTSRKAEACEEVVAEIVASGGKAEARACNVGNTDEISATVAAVVERHGRLDILVNNAAANPYYGPVLDMDLGAYQKTVDVNIRGYFWASVEAGRRMKEQGGGVIVNIGSISGLRPSPNTAAYGAAKAGLVNLTQTLAMEWAPSVRVNMVTAGLVLTDDTAQWYGEGEALARVAATVPMGRMATPADIADAVVAVASLEYLTGANLVLHGGGERPPFLEAAGR